MNLEVVEMHTFNAEKIFENEKTGRNYGLTTKKQLFKIFCMEECLFTKFVSWE